MSKDPVLAGCELCMAPPSALRTVNALLARAMPDDFILNILDEQYAVEVSAAQLHRHIAHLPAPQAELRMLVLKNTTPDWDKHTPKTFLEQIVASAEQALAEGRLELNPNMSVAAAKTLLDYQLKIEQNRDSQKAINAYEDIIGWCLENLPDNLRTEFTRFLGEMEAKYAVKNA